MKEITKEDWIKLKSYHCDKGKHRFRSNHFGVTWCTICGALSSKDAPQVQEDECLIIKTSL